MGRSFTASSGKNVVFTSANAIVQARQIVSTALNGVVKGEVIRSSSLNGVVTLYSQTDLSAALNAVIPAPTPLSSLAKFYYKLESIDSTEIDSVAGLYTGSIPSGGHATGKIGNGMILTGGSQRMNISGSPSLGTAWTIAMWIKPTADNTAGLMAHNNNTYGFFRTSDKKINYYDAASFFTSSGITPLNTWSHVAITHDGTTVKFYINGALDPNSYTRPAATFVPLQLGADQFGNGFVGTIDEAGAWTRVLTANDIANLHNAGAGIQYPF